MTMRHTTALTGGIGVGKSVVARILRVLGYEVIDCDSCARDIMDRSDLIKSQLADRISPRVIDSGNNIDRRLLASIVFSDSRMLDTLNSIVHESVRQHIRRRASDPGGSRLFVETAILYQSGIDRMADEVWQVTAPDEIRVARVIERNHIPADEVMARIRSQHFVPDNPHPHVFDIVNDGFTPLLPRILYLLNNKPLES